MRDDKIPLVIIYFSCSITGGRNDQLVYEAIVNYLLAEGNEVPTAHLALESGLREERAMEARQVYERDTQWVKSCDALIAEVSTPSHGVGYEVAMALLLDKPVLCCYRKGSRVSKMILGNTQKNISLIAYENANELIGAIDAFLKSIST
ncbi:MAG: nucleoside 2-deoxyribosyltransferase [Pelolinea sp.]|nr:nucleoside 2-deoxyribosyltransferase [Pelolinea sp.]